MDKKARAQALDKLEAIYGAESCALHFGQPLDLLVATILSAQCTDIQVNKITQRLFERCHTARDYAQMDVLELEGYIKSCGFYHHKARNIILACQRLLTQYNGEVPDCMEELLTLPGVGRKTANVVLSNAFAQDAIAVDTHVFRVSNRLGLARAKDVYKTEMQLRKHIPRAKWSSAHHWLIWHGRRVCRARRPDCVHCPLTPQCDAYKKGLVRPAGTSPGSPRSQGVV